MREKVNMLIDSVKGEIGKIVLEEATPALVGEILKGTVVEAATEVAGIVAPGVGNIMLSYKQKKLEKNFEIFLSKMVDHQDEINKRLEKLETERKMELQKNYFGLLADYAMQSKQEEKIEFIVNGFVNIAGAVLFGTDLVLLYYDVLDQLNLLDLRILRLYAVPRYLGDEDENTDDIVKISREYDLDFSQLDMIKEKLVRLGLLERKNDISLEENVKYISEYLEDLSKGKKNSKLKRLNKMSRSESYKITSFGHRFFRFFCGIVEERSEGLTD